MTKKAGPDFGRMKEIAEEAQRLERADGSLSREDYDRLRAQALDAAAGDEDLVEFIDNREPA